MKDSIQRKSCEGFVLVAVLLTMLVLMAILATYSMVTRFELLSQNAAANSTQGFYAAEAGLNLRAEEIRQTFVGYNRPSGSSPEADGACDSGNIGSGSFQCKTFDLGNHQAETYVVEEPGNPLILTIPPGERYQNLNAQEYRYTVISKGIGPRGAVEAILELEFKSRLVPMFQFAAFYNKDLEILPGALMVLTGPVHTNGELYLNTEDRLQIDGQVTSARSLYRGRKNENRCDSKPVEIKNPASYRTLFGSCSTRRKVLESDVTSWNGMIEMDVPEVTVPEPEEFDALPGKLYWDKADLRLVLHLASNNTPDLTAAATGVEVRTAQDEVDTVRTSALNNGGLCSGTISGRAIGSTNSFYNNREGSYIRMLEIDMRALLNCMHSQSLMDDGKQLNDTTEGGIVIYATVKGPESLTQNSRYGVRVRNGAILQATIGGAPVVKGLTIVSDQPFYSQGHYNSNSAQKIPSAFLVDSYNTLSVVWSDSNLTFAQRVPADTTVNAAILAGTDTTGNIEGVGGQNLGRYNGGLENYPRLHEDWSKSPKKIFTYKGSFVSLEKPRRVSGQWVYGSPQYTAPERVWSYDTSFNDAAKLPPITPRFVYLRQQLFLRDYEQE